MKYNEFCERIEKLTVKGSDLNDCEITANRINGVAVLIVKNEVGKVVESIVLSDDNYCEAVH